MLVVSFRCLGLGLGFTLSQLGQARRGSWCEVGVKQDTESPRRTRPETRNAKTLTAQNLTGAPRTATQQWQPEQTNHTGKVPKRIGKQRKGYVAATIHQQSRKASPSQIYLRDRVILPLNKTAHYNQQKPTSGRMTQYVGAKVTLHTPLYRITRLEALSLTGVVSTRATSVQA